MPARIRGAAPGGEPVPAPCVSRVDGRPDRPERECRSPGSLPWVLRSLTGGPGSRTRSALARRGPATHRRAARPAPRGPLPRPRRATRAAAERSPPSTPSPRPPTRRSEPPRAQARRRPSARRAPAARAPPPPPPASPRRSGGSSNRVRARLARLGVQRSTPYNPVLEPLLRIVRSNDPKIETATLRQIEQRLPGRRALAPRPEAQERRPVHHAPARRHDHPRRARHGPGHPDGGTAARHRRGHRVRPGHAAPRLRRPGRPARRRRHQARQGQVRRGRAGRDRTQDGRRHGQGPARPGHQARRPAAQHAHHALSQAGEAGEEGPRDPGDLRAARPPPGHEHHQVGAGGPRLRDPLPQDVRRDRPARRRAGAQARRVPRHSDRRGPVRPARRPHQGHRHRPPEALLQRLPEDDRPRP